MFFFWELFTFNNCSSWSLLLGNWFISQSINESEIRSASSIIRLTRPRLSHNFELFTSRSSASFYKQICSSVCTLDTTMITIKRRTAALFYKGKRFSAFAKLYKFCVPDWSELVWMKLYREISHPLGAIYNIKRKLQTEKS